METDSHFAAQELCLGDVAYGSKADIAAAFPNVCFTLKSGHHRAFSARPLSAVSGHHSARYGTVHRCLVAARINDGPCKAPRVGKAKFVTTWNLY